MEAVAEDEAVVEVETLAFPTSPLALNARVVFEASVHWMPPIT